MGNVLYLNEPPADYVGNPQVEDGFTPIANELLDAIIRFDFTKRELNIVLFVIRKTYGYNKKSDWIALSQFADGTGLDRGNLSKTVSDLVDMNVLLKRQHNSTYVVGLNKHYGTWKELSKQQRGCQNNNSGVVKTTTTKNKLTKDNISIVQNAFDACWLEYPRKESKGQALKAFKKLGTDRELLATVFKAIKSQKVTSGSQLSREKQYIPLFSTWLNAQAWLDEHTPDPVKPKKAVY